MSAILTALRKSLRKGAHEAWFRKHEDFSVIAAAGEADLLLLGDSITEGWRAGPGRKIWQERFGAYNTANFGIGGDTTHEVLWRLRNGEMGTLRPKLIIILAGTNNLVRNESTETIKTSINKIIGLVRAHSPSSEILVLGILPRGRRLSRYRKQIIDINTEIASTCRSMGSKFLDAGHLFLQSDGEVCLGLMPDRLHLSALGYGALARVLGQHIYSAMKA